MILKQKIAVAFKIIGTNEIIEKIMDLNDFTILQSAAGKSVVIIEAWTMGKCVSN